MREEELYRSWCIQERISGGRMREVVGQTIRWWPSRGVVLSQWQGGGRNKLRALTAEGKQRETQVPGHLLPVVGKALRWEKSGVSTPYRPPASPPDHPPRPRIADCTLYIRLLSAKKTTMRASPSNSYHSFSSQLT